MGGMTLGKSAEQMMREREAINRARRRSIRNVEPATDVSDTEAEMAPINFGAISRYIPLQKAQTKTYAKGGVTRADGCVRKGHTKGKMR